LVNFQGSPRSYKAIYPNEQKDRQKCQEACVDEQEAPGHAQAQKEPYKEWNQG